MKKELFCKCLAEFLGTSLAAWLYEYMRCEKKEDGDNKPHAKGCC